MEDLVSVIIPTYKRPTDLKRAIYSVLKQTYTNIEIKIVDDNNSDSKERVETELLMEEFKDYSQIEYIKHDKNKNGSAARNTGWKKSKGTFITFLDDDDEISPDKIKRQVECLNNLDSSWGACYTAYNIIRPNGGYQISSEKRSGYLYIEALMRTMFMGSGSNLFLRKSVIDEVNGYDESFIRNQDIELLTRVTEKYKLAYVDESLLTIHLEIRQFNRTFEQLEQYTKHYLKVFSEKINALPEKDRKRVISVISLERARVAILGYRKWRAAIKILKENNVSLLYIFDYIFYLLHRVITHKSYGYSGR